MSTSGRNEFINFCNTRKNTLLKKYPKATAEEIVKLMIHEFNELTPLPPSFIDSKNNTTLDIERAFEPLTISGLLFVKK